MRDDVVIVGGGLAGSEAAWQAANRGARGTLYDMRRKKMTKARKTGGLAEPVGSRSAGPTHPPAARTRSALIMSCWASSASRQTSRRRNLISS